MDQGAADNLSSLFQNKKVAGLFFGQVTRKGFLRVFEELPDVPPIEGKIVRIENLRQSKKPAPGLVAGKGALFTISI